MGQLGEEDSVAVEWKAEGDLCEEGLFEPSLDIQRVRPGPEPCTAFRQRVMGTLHLMNASPVASVQGGLEEWRGPEEGRQQECCCGNHRELAKGSPALGVALVVRGKASRD